jgi:hypothetical protein
MRSIMASVPDCSDVSVSIATTVVGKHILFTCQPSGRIVGIACNRESGPLTKLELAQLFADFIVSAPQVVQDKINAALAAAQTSVGAT